MSPGVGIVMPLHNKRLYVVRAIESPLAQTHSDFKLTVVNDELTDGTAEYIERISDPRIFVMNTECRHRLAPPH